MSDFKFMFGMVAWHTYMTSLRRTVVRSAVYQANATERASFLIADQIQELSEAQSKNLQSLEASIELGFGLIGEKLDRQAELLEEISESLSEIKETLSAPEQTRAEEQFRIGKTRWNAGLLKEALSAFKKVESINEVDPTLQLVLGKIYLYGVDEGESLIDLELARAHFLKALRFSKLSQSQQIQAEIFYHAAVLFFVFASEGKLSGDGSTLENLTEAGKHCSRAIELWPYATDYRYLLCKIHVSDASTVDLAHSELIRLFSLSPYYAYLAEQDENFRPIKDSLKDVSAASEKTVLRRAAVQLVDGVRNAEQEARKLNAEELAPARFNVLRKAQQEIADEIIGGWGYVPKNIAESMHLALAYYELAAACRPCFDFNKNLQLILLERQRRIDLAERQKLLSDELESIREQLPRAQVRTETFGNWMSRITKGPTELDLRFRHLSSELSDKQEKLAKTKRELAEIDDPVESHTQGLKCCVRLDGLDEKDFLFIRREDKDVCFIRDEDEDAFLCESEEKRRRHVARCVNGFETTKSWFEAVFRDLWIANKSVIENHAEVKDTLFRQVLSGEWSDISFPGISDADLDKLNRSLARLKDKTRNYGIRVAYGLTPMYYNIPRTLYSRIGPEDEKRISWENSGPEHATSNPQMLPHNLLFYRKRSTICGEVAPESGRPLSQSAKAFLDMWPSKRLASPS